MRSSKEIRLWVHKVENLKNQTADARLSHSVIPIIDQSFF